MRFLCLHGRGTNNQVFETQTAALRYKLGANHEFEFVEGSIPSPQAPGLSKFFPSQDQYYSYVASESIADVSSCLDDLSEYVESNGPFDAFMGFSEGATIAMAFLSQYQNPSKASAEGIKAAIFICAGKPFNILGKNKTTSTAMSEEIVDIPTLHVIGKRDPVYADSLELSRMCKKERREVLEFYGGHEVPMSTKLVGEIATAFEKVVERNHFVC
ncbi:serine hydrolase FSH [Tricladium varicosporioides]|nr:serine hydrolase FSH [Hymenoscyphus varicosporioides]